VGWLQVMLGQCLQPQQYNAMADSLSEKDVREYLKNLNSIMTATVKKLQPYAEFIESCSA